MHINPNFLAKTDSTANKVLQQFATKAKKLTKGDAASVTEKTPKIATEIRINTEIKKRKIELEGILINTVFYLLNYYY